MADKAAQFASSEQWRRFGDLDPYFGVISDDKYRKDRLDEHVRAEFFESGRLSVSQVLTLLAEYVPTDKPLRRVLDFGCGVGRLALAFANVADEQVLGVDVSPGMLEETNRNAVRAGLTNVHTRLTDELGQEDVEFDLIHSQCVFQHIRPELGQPLLISLLRRVRSGGQVAVHVTTQPVTRIGRAYFFAVLRAPFIARMWNLVRRREWSYPLMEMHSYDIDTLIRVFADEGFAATVVVPVAAHGRTEYYGAWLLSQRRSSRGA
jgi:SAM-dependent methyltransferase